MFIVCTLCKMVIFLFKKSIFHQQFISFLSKMDFLAKIDYISLAPAQLHLQFKLSLPTYLSFGQKLSQRQSRTADKCVFNLEGNIPLKNIQKVDQNFDRPTDLGGRDPGRGSPRNSFLNRFPKKLWIHQRLN